MKKQNPKPRFRLEDIAKIPESTIKLFKEVISKKRTIKEATSEENTSYTCCIPDDPYDYLNIKCENDNSGPSYEGGICNCYTEK